MKIRQSECFSLKWACLVSVFFLSFLVAASAYGEVSADRSSSLAFMGGGGSDSDDVFPMLQTRLHVEYSYVLNATGAANGDRGAVFAIDPQTGRPFVAWSWFDGSDYEVVISQWGGSGWTAKEIVTDNAVDDLDPSIAFGADGSCKVSWWRPGSGGEVWYRDKVVGGTWAGEERVSAQVEVGSRPSVVEHQLSTRVAYQIENGGITEIRAASRNGEWQSELIATTAYLGPAGDGDIDVEVHSRGDRLWIDWVDAAGQLAFTVYDAAGDTWSVPQSRSYSVLPGEREVDARGRARVSIRLEVLD